MMLISACVRCNKLVTVFDTNVNPPGPWLNPDVFAGDSRLEYFKMVSSNKTYWKYQC